jgi:hypothetical protein
MDINQFLQWLLGSGGSIIAASWILERIGKFQAQTPDIKEWIFFGLSAIFSVGSYLVITFVPAEIIAAIGPYFLIVSGLFVTIVVGKMFHSVDKK